MPATCCLALVGVALVATLAVALGSWTSPVPAEAQEPRFHVQGTVTDPEGKPVRGLLVILDGHGESWGARHIDHTEADGTFSFDVPEGTYRLVTTTAFASECLVEGYENPKSGWEVTIAVGDGDIAGIEVTASGSGSSPPALVFCSFPEETLGHVKGTVTDDEGQPVEGLWITANVHRSAGVYEGEFTASDGTFHLRLRHGIYWLHIHTEGYNECTVSGYDAPGARGPAIFDTGDGDVAGLQVVVSGSSSESKVWSRCKFDAPLPRIEGAVLGPNGEPLQGISVRAFGEFDTDSFGPWDSPDTGSNGTFSIEVPDGSYAVQLFRTIDGAECSLGYVNPDSGHTFVSYEVDRFVVSEESVTGLTVRLPDTPSALCRPITGTVTDSDGQSLGTVHLAVDSAGPIHGVRASGKTKEDSTFTLYGQPASYTLLISTRDGQACKVVDNANAPPGVRARIEVTEDGASNIRVVVSGQPSDAWQRFYCSFPPRMVATELQPGWNLAGWTGDNVDVSELFGGIPALEVVHAWDAERERFLTAVAGVPDEVSDLRTLTPGMGLWLYLGGTEPVEWTRPFMPESGFVTLAEGWNLVSWSGEDGLAADDALAALGAELRAAAAWDPTTGRDLHYSPATPASERTLQQLSRGSALLVQVSDDRNWLQPGSAQSHIEYVSEIPADARASLPSEIESVLAYFAHRFGVFVPGLTWIVGEHPTYCGAFAGWAIFLEEPCLRATAHEYTHAIQAYMAGPGNSAAWVTEGVANRWSAEYYAATGNRSYSTHITDIVLPHARLTPITLEEMEAGLFIEDYANANYNVAHLAIDWLIATTGEDRIFDYYLRRPAYSTWQEAFAGVFGISVEDFYRSFAEHRTRVAPVAPRIQGTVLDHEGNPVMGARLRAAPTEGQRSAWDTTDDQGVFSLAVSQGSYTLEVHMPYEETTNHAGWFAEGAGFTPRRGEATQLQVKSEDLPGVAVRIPDLTWYRVEGVVLGPDGAGLEGIGVDAFPRSEYAAPGSRTDANGAFSMRVLGGSLELHLYGDTPDGRKPIGAYGRENGYSPLFEDATTLHIEGQDITGVTIRFPVDPAPAQWQRIEGVVLGPNGEPQEGISVDAYPTGEAPGLAATTNADGAFSILVLEGPFELHLRADTPSGHRYLGAYGGDEGFVPSGRQPDVVEVRTADVTGITINLPVSFSGE